MPILRKPTVHAPEYVITMERTLEFARKAHAANPRLVRPIVETLDRPRGVSGVQPRRDASCLLPITDASDLATYEEGPPPTDATGVIAGFGPGITAEQALGTWVDGTPHHHGERPAAQAAPRPYAGRIV